MMVLNEKGQAAAGYRLIIGAVLAFFILMIILGAINYFQNIKTQITSEALTSGLNSAKASPDGSVVKKKAIYFAESIYTKRFFSLQSGLDEDCLELTGRQDSIINVIDGRRIVIERAITENVYFRCVTSDHFDAFNSDCEINCWVSMGVDLREED